MTRKKANALPSDEAILERKAAFQELVKKVVTGEIKVEKPKRETVADKLALIREELALLKEFPYSTICQLIKDQFDLTLSQQTLRKFCQDELGFPKKNAKPETTEEKPAKKKAKKKGFNAEDDLASKEMKFK